MTRNLHDALCSTPSPRFDGDMPPLTDAERLADAQDRWAEREIRRWKESKWTANDVWVDGRLRNGEWP